MQTPETGPEKFFKHPFFFHNDDIMEIIHPSVSIAFILCWVTVGLEQGAQGAGHSYHRANTSTHTQSYDTGSFGNIISPHHMSLDCVRIRKYCPLRELTKHMKNIQDSNPNFGNPSVVCIGISLILHYKLFCTSQTHCLYFLDLIPNS